MEFEYDHCTVMDGYDTMILPLYYYSVLQWGGQQNAALPFYLSLS